MDPMIHTMFRRRGVTSTPTVLAKCIHAIGPYTVVEMESTASLKKQDAQGIVKCCSQSGYQNVIVCGQSISRPSLAVFAQHNITFVPATVYSLDRMASAFVPHYRRLSSTECTQLQEKHKCALCDFPKLCYNDPVAVYMGFRAGELVEVRSRAGEVNYRCVH